MLFSVHFQDVLRSSVVDKEWRELISGFDKYRNHEIEHWSERRLDGLMLFTVHIQDVLKSSDVVK